MTGSLRTDTDTGFHAPHLDDDRVVLLATALVPALYELVGVGCRLEQLEGCVAALALHAATSRALGRLASTSTLASAGGTALPTCFAWAVLVPVKM